MVSQPQTSPDLADNHFRHWKSVFEDLTGIQLAAEREGLVKSVLRARLIEKGVSCFENYLQQLLASPAFGKKEWDVLFERILIGETRFFRHKPTYDFIAGHIKQSLRLDKSSSVPTVKIWSPGCSSGEEVYSLAIVAYRLCKGLTKKVDFSVTGTDINVKSLEQAKAGVYSNILRKGIDAETANAFFDQRPGGVFEVRQFLKGCVKFSKHNLLEPVASNEQRGLDIISCQNLLIYLQGWRRRAVIRQLIPSLKIGGVLIVGPGELLGWKPEGLVRVPVDNVQAYAKVM